jgi:hypothetical protein
MQNQLKHMTVFEKVNQYLDQVFHPMHMLVLLTIQKSSGSIHLVMGGVDEHVS